MIIPVGFVANLLGKAGKADKALGNILRWVDGIMEKAFGLVLSKSASVFQKILDIIKAIANKLRGGTTEIKKIIEKIFITLKEWLESFVGKIGEAGIFVFENLQMKVERISKLVNNKLTEYYLVTYKRKNNLQLYMTIFPIQDFLAVFSRLINQKVKSNLETLSKQGYEILEEKGRYYIKKDDTITELGNAQEAAVQLNKLLDDIGTKAKKQLDDAIAWRKKLDEFEIQRKTNPRQYWNDFKYKDLLPPPTPTKKPCFLAGTLIATPKGNIAIEKIQTGDEVYCFDTIKQSYTAQAVSQIFSNVAEKYVQIITEYGETICATGQHLFYQKETNTWVKANQLQQGMQLFAPLANKTISIAQITIIENKVNTYNFEVPIHHNYLVSTVGILAHNAGKYKTVDDLSTRKYAFYQLLTLDNNLQGTTQYIGKTTRTRLDLRLTEHIEHAIKKGHKSKHYWKFAEKPQIANLHKGALEMVEMTEIQSAVWEKYFLEEYRFKTGTPLRNISNPISEARFNALKKSGKHANICSFF